MIEFLGKLALLLFLLSLPVGGKPIGGSLRRAAAFSGLLGLLVLFLQLEATRWQLSAPSLGSANGWLLALGISTLAYGALMVRRHLGRRRGRGERPERWAFIGKDRVEPPDGGRP